MLCEQVGLTLPVGRGDVFAGDVGDSPRATVAHREFQFALHDFDHAIDTVLAEGSQSPKKWTANPDRFGAECQCLEYIGAAPKAAVDVHRNFAANFGHDFRESFDRCAQGIRGTSAV